MEKDEIVIQFRLFYMEICVHCAIYPNEKDILYAKQSVFDRKTDVCKKVQKNLTKNHIIFCLYL